MSSLTSATDQRSPTEQTPSREPIAIIGIGCRFPQAEGPEAFWRLLRDGVDAITEVPPDRFDINAYYDPRPGTPGKLISRYGGFIEGIEQFDPYFFGISPREAAGMDPQQRLALETAWAAIEDAGLPRARLAGSATGVFIGVCGLDYHTQLDAALGEAAQDIYAVNGNLRAVVPGRVSFWLGLQGPSIAVDAACASSLVAIQLACQSLWSGECTLALAGGVNVVLMPGIGLGFSRAGMLAPDGRCKFGDAAADGFVRSDGAAMLALKPLARARAEGDPIYALIRGGAVNNDGQGSGALMTPSRSGQEAVLRAAYRQAGVDPGRVAFVESHGTGTVAGDPVELDALGAVLGERRAPGAPCLVGSVKTNIGHTEATAGVAGVIKAALALKHGLIPPTLHVRSLNPAVDWDALPVRMARQATPWPAGELPRFAGISSFGISGTNAHLVLQEAPPASPAAPSEVYPAQRPEASGVPLPQLLALSAHTPEALRALAAAHAEALAAAQPGGTPYEDWCRTAAVRRTHHRHRLALVAGDADDAARRLRATAGANAAAPGMYLGQETATRAGGDQPHGLVWVFPGHGVQWLGMGKALLEHEPAFREALDRCDHRPCATTSAGPSPPRSRIPPNATSTASRSSAP